MIELEIFNLLEYDIQRGLSYNKTPKALPVSFNTAFAAVSIGFEDSDAFNGDGEPRVRVLSTTYILTNTGHGSESSSIASFFIAIGK